MRSIKVLLATTILVLALAGAAHAGCMATVGLSSVPTGVAPGETWGVDLNVLQHGQEPLSGATPTVILTEQASGQEKSFDAVPTGTRGRYHADVVFPSAGTWSVAVNDGFPVEECAQTHTFGSFGIGAAAQPPSPPPAEPAPAVAPSDPASFPYWALGLGAAVLAVVAVGLVMYLGRARPRSQQAPLPGR